MPILVNLRHLDAHDMELTGDLAAEELDLGLSDEVIQVEKPLRYALQIQKLERSILVQGSLDLPLRCECVRCLKAFEYRLDLRDRTWHLPLEGEEQVAVINDCVDLTPYLREDILLEFPQHPLCEADCRGLLKTDIGKPNKPSDEGPIKGASSAWAKLDKLKL